MIPARRLFYLLWSWLATAIVAAFWPSLAALWIGSAVLIVLVAGYDLLAVLRQPEITVVRRVAASLALGVWSEVRLRIHAAAKSSDALEIADHTPAQVEARGMPTHIRIPAQGWVEVSYEIRPTERGEQCFGSVQLRVASRWGLWQQSRTAGASECVKVYPNFAAVTRYALLATDNRLSMMGIRLRQRRGEGLEFHQLRDYRSGDMLRQIDWKATSRLHKLTSREYQDERDQQVVFLLDCGRRMHAKDGELSHFDHALNAVLLLAYVALRQGDTVGLMGFGGRLCYMPPGKGMATINRLLDAVYDLQAGTASPDFLQAATTLMQRLKKRSLVVLVTNLRDEDNAELLPALQLMRKRHLVLLASLQERIINDVLMEPIRHFDAALRNSATHLYLNERRKAHEAIKAYGVLSVDVEPAQLPVSLVNRYLDIKRSGRL
ncbi:MAG: DUF58 domain-containing protein [Pseudomonadota bacterium]